LSKKNLKTHQKENDLMSHIGHYLRNFITPVVPEKIKTKYHLKTKWLGLDCGPQNPPSFYLK